MLTSAAKAHVQFTALVYLAQSGWNEPTCVRLQRRRRRKRRCQGRGSGGGRRTTARRTAGSRACPHRRSCGNLRPSRPSSVASSPSRTSRTPTRTPPPPEVPFPSPPPVTSTTLQTICLVFCPMTFPVTHALGGIVVSGGRRRRRSRESRQ
jgi:hypothetical protein